MEHNFQDFDTDFRKDFETRYKTRGHSYDRFQPAYKYGFEAHNRFSGRDWQSIESDLRSDWQRTHPNDAWEDFKDAVRTGFDRMKQGAREMGRDVERGIDRTTSEMSRTFETYDRDFRSDFDRSFGNRGYDYQRFRPAYQYGYSLATEKRFRGRNWNDIEMDARRDWDRQHPGEAWDDFKDAVKNAYQRVRSDVKDALD